MWQDGCGEKRVSNQAESEMSLTGVPRKKLSHVRGAGAAAASAAGG